MGSSLAVDAYRCRVAKIPQGMINRAGPEGTPPRSCRKLYESVGHCQSQATGLGGGDQRRGD